MCVCHVAFTAYLVYPIRIHIQPFLLYTREIPHPAERGIPRLQDTAVPLRIIPAGSLFFIITFIKTFMSRRFYPQRPSGQAAVTGVVPSPIRYLPFIFIVHRFVGFNNLPARRFPSNVAFQRSRAFRYNQFVLLYLWAKTPRRR